MIPSYKILFFFLVLSAFTRIKAQRIFFEQITTAEGLPSDYINSIYEDRKGGLWVGTDKGACRYDGRTFQYLNNDDGLLSNFISCFDEDLSGNIWIGTINAGLCKYDGKKITLFKKLEDKDQNIFEIHFNQDGSFFIIAGGSGFKHLYYFKNEFSFPQKFQNMAFLKTLSPGLYLTGSLHQLYLLELKNKSPFFHPLPKPVVPDASFLYWQGGNSVMAAKKKSVIEFTTDGYQWFLRKEFPVNKFNLYPDWSDVKNLLVSDERLLMATSYGLIYIDKENKEHFFNAENGLGSNFVSYLYKDKSNTIYIGTFGGGIKIWPKRYISEFKTNGKVTSIFHNGNRSFITTTKSLYYFNSPLERLDEFKNGGIGNFTSIYQDQTGDIYLGMLNNFCKISANNISYQSNKINKSTSYSANSGTSGFIANKKNIYISTYGDGMYIKNRLTQQTDTLDETTNPMAHQIIEFLLPLRSSFAALTYNSGLTIYDSLGGYKNITKTEGLLSNTVYTAYQENENEIWIGSQNGLNLYDGKRVVKTYSVENGLSGTKVVCVFRDSLKRFWVLSDKYLHLLENDRLRTIRSHPVLFDEKSTINRAAYNAATQTLFIGLTDAMHIVSISKVTPNTEVETPVLDWVKKDTVNIPGEENLITIKHPISGIIFQFNSKYNSITRRSEISYKLQGFDDDWKPLPETGEINYPKLSPGHYELFAKSVNPDGYESHVQSLAKMEVLPPIWKRRWFITAVTFFFLCLFYYIVNLFSKRRYKYKLENLQEKYNLQMERERIARELHDNVGSQLTYLINKIDDDYVHLSEKKEAEKLSGFARGAMRELKETIWALDKKEVRGEELKNKIKQLLHLYRNEKYRIELKWEIDNAEEWKLNPVQALNTYRIVQEALNNAEKYSNAGEIKISAFIKDRIICIEIADNGNGFDVEEVEGGYGLKNMKKRAEEMNARLIVKSLHGSGTLLRLEFS